jgi:hypothetical protein
MCKDSLQSAEDFKRKLCELCSNKRLSDAKTTSRIETKPHYSIHREIADKKAFDSQNTNSKRFKKCTFKHFRLKAEKGTKKRSESQKFLRRSPSPFTHTC